MNIFNIILTRYKKYKNPVKYWRSKGVVIGENCELRSVEFGSEPYLITIGDHVRINAGVVLVTHDGGAWVLRQCSDIENHENITVFGKITIGNNVHIGSNAIIMPNVTIGDNVIIGCGAVVTRNIPSNTIAAGVPAKVIETIEEYEKKHLEDFCFTKSWSRSQVKTYLMEKYGGYNTKV